MLIGLGIDAIVADVFDSARLREVMVDFQPGIVIHQLTDLPYALESSKMADALIRNARLRDEGTRNLVGAAVLAGARQLIAQSISFIYADGSLPHKEEDPLLADTHPTYGGTVIGVKSLEHQVLSAALEGIVLRYGLLYGPGTGFDAPIAPGSVHVSAAAKAAALAMTYGKPGVYNIAENDGSVTTEKATQILGWDANWRPNIIC
jgi:nucleoside-diphosphate-sugar epimerase